MASDIPAIARQSNFISQLEGRVSKLDRLKKQERRYNTRNASHMLSAIKRIANESTKKLRELKEKRRNLKHRLRFNHSFGSLPFDVRMHVMRHTRLDDIKNLAESGMAAGEILKSHQRAVSRGMEVEQFFELKWAFGDSKYRSPEQKQALKDFFALGFLPRHSCMIAACRMVDNDTFDGWLNVSFLQAVLDYINDIAYQVDDMLLRRTIVCLTMFQGKRVSSLAFMGTNGEHSIQYRDMGGDLDRPGYHISLEEMTIQERVELFDMQPGAIRAQIRDVIERGVVKIIQHIDDWARREGFDSLMGPGTADWIGCYYGSDKVDYKMERKQMGPWIGYLATGYILKGMLHRFGDGCMDVAAEVWRHTPSFHDALESELMNSGSTDGYWRAERRFAKRIGFDWRCILRDSAVEWYLKEHQLDSRLRSRTI